MTVPSSPDDQECESSEMSAAQLERAFFRYRSRLKRIVELRLNWLVRRRMDASDILQEVFVDAYRRLDEYRQTNGWPVFLWLRFLASQKVAEMHRKHLRTEARSVYSEVSLHLGGLSRQQSSEMIRQLMDAIVSPRSHLIRQEQNAHLMQAIDRLTNTDREVIILRHFEQLTNREVAQLLEISENGASSRYVRAIHRLRQLIDRAHL
ncbi:MAG: sigma-70 family RNA polymerase sigma factor [Pirellulales bacterium]